jgi:glycosyltransferase involved in cell wall biosynthesis
VSDGAVDVLVPTCNRPCGLAMTLTSLAAQTVRAIRIVISDQSDGAGALAQPEVASVLRFLAASGRIVQPWRHVPRLGMAEQRAFLLQKVSAPYCLFLDDDVLLENDLIERLLRAMAEQQCGFVGSALHGLSYVDTVRPHQQHIEFWEAPVTPEFVAPGSAAWARHHLHSAANLFHLQRRLGLTPETTRHYRVAWVGGCVLFDTAKLRAAGGFDFWTQLPPDHCGEDVLAQLRVMQRFGGCGIIPSGAYHMELPTTITQRQVDAPKVLWPEPGMHAQHGAGPGAVERQ